MLQRYSYIFVEVEIAWTNSLKHFRKNLILQNILDVLMVLISWMGKEKTHTSIVVISHMSECICIEVSLNTIQNIFIVQQYKTCFIAPISRQVYHCWRLYL